MEHRRRFILQLIALGASLSLMPFAHADWPQWRGPNRDGVWSETGIMESFPADGLKTKWRAPVGRGWSSPVVAQGRVFVTDVELKAPDAWERVLCFDETTGKPLWTHRYTVKYPDWAFSPTGGGLRATPIIRDGRIYTLGALGDLFCFDAATGNVVWQKSLANDKNSGAEVWRALDDAFTYSSPIVITAGGQRQLIVWTQEAVTSLDPSTGHTWWRELNRISGDMAVSTSVFSNPYLLAGRGLRGQSAVLRQG
jgi:outer membrane protein assembly factor BamB